MSKEEREWEEKEEERERERERKKQPLIILLRVSKYWGLENNVFPPLAGGKENLLHIPKLNTTFIAYSYETREQYLRLPKETRKDSAFLHECLSQIPRYPRKRRVCSLHENIPAAEPS